MEAVVLHDFHATANDELSFQKNAVLKVLDTAKEKDWYRAELDGKEGLIPNNYVQMKADEWYQGVITWAKAEEVLVHQPNDGAFLIRDCKSTPGDFSLSVKVGGGKGGGGGEGVEHFKVLRDRAGKYLLWVVKFNSINQLVQYHRTSSVSRERILYLTDMVTVVKALFNFEAQEADELRLREGDIITVLDRNDQNWWKGLCNGNKGMFPVPYVKELKYISPL